MSDEIVVIDSPVDKAPVPPKGKPKPKAPAEAPPAPPVKRTGKSPKPRPPASEADLVRVVQLLDYAADRTRLGVMLRLLEGEMSVKGMAQELNVSSQPAISHHLAILRHGSLVTYRRSGKQNLYGLTDEGRKLARVVRGLLP